ncbi:MAG: monofunctional biosynthetic peptidoglycan transglycosylase [Rhodospirillales bacterium]|nr:monofunctional biosynthetic peptidoglycan transglycosylase [Rhodospirillales bacterium]
MLLMPTLIIAIYRFVSPPLTPLMMIRSAQGEQLDHRAVPLSRVSPHLVAAVVAAEDNLFCRHRGFDIAAMRDEFDNWLGGERPRGASTITMQTAKNILLWPGRDPLRKLLEAALTPQIEFLWSKRRIMEVYLGIIEMGPGIYGAEAAARQYFGKPASALGAREAALIAAILPNPREWSPIRPNRLVARHASRIQRRMARLGPLLGCLEDPIHATDRHAGGIAPRRSPY